MSTPTVNDYVADPGDHGVMARYQSFNLSPGADAAMELLEALFVLHDEVFGKTHRGLITLEKRMGPVFEDVEAVSPADEDFLSSLIQNDGWMLPQLWDAMECQYFLVDKHQQNPFKQFRKPTHAALTRTGFIKFLILRYLESLDNRDSKAYNTLVGLSDKYRLLIPGTARPVMPLHDRAQVDANFRDLARELQIPSDRILRQLKAFRATGPIKPGPTATAPATSRDSPPPPPLPARPRANSRGNISITSSSSGSIDSSDISSIAYRPAAPPPEPPRSPSPPPHVQRRRSQRRSAAEIEREREEMELRAKEQELRDLQQRYERVARERNGPYYDERDYIREQQRQVAAVTRGFEEPTHRTRRVGPDSNYYTDYRHRR